MTGATSEMMKEIESSRLGSAEKAFLIAEWGLREHRPYELYEINMGKMKKKVRMLLKRWLPPRTLTSAIERVKLTFQIVDDEKAVSLLVALAYFAYIHNEIVHDHVLREEMLSKEVELGFSLSEIELFYRKWAKVFGNSKDLFNRIFLK